MRITTNDNKLYGIYKRYILEKILLFAFITVFAVIVFLTEIFIDKQSTKITIIAAVIVYFRFFFESFKNIQLLNHIVMSVSYENMICIDTFPVSALFGLITKEAICLEFTKSNVKIYEATNAQPFNQRILRSQDNFILERQGEYFFLIRDLFEDEMSFNRFVNTVKSE